MSKRDIGQEILEGIQEIKAHKAGKIELRTRELKATPVIDVGKKLNGRQECHSEAAGRRVPVAVL